MNIDKMNAKGLGMYGSKEASRDYSGKELKGAKDEAEAASEPVEVDALQKHAEKLQSVKSPIRDWDTAKTAAGSAKEGILAQPERAIKAQGNILAESAVQLLG